ncbi:hypothetical protein ISN44_As07g014400 [Arabidopsis suecica]|uniref:Uncharacterized protein n=1 Tax=Arabidopsis suecica TaxID=45249 RepID=A0A8T2BQK8_ARASU|nr:hypothetical protein ISN44_As07g014400 [Arabidopsis suecica]
MLGRRERSLRKLKEGERVVDSTSNKNLSSFVFLGLRIKVLVGNTGSSLPVKQGANRPLWFASSQSLTYLDDHPSHVFYVSLYPKIFLSLATIGFFVL